jgi:hypothetical protein
MLVPNMVRMQTSDNFHHWQNMDPISTVSFYSSWSNNVSCAILNGKSAFKVKIVGHPLKYNGEPPPSIIIIYIYK